MSSNNDGGYSAAVNNVKSTDVQFYDLKSSDDPSAKLQSGTGTTSNTNIGWNENILNNSTCVPVPIHWPVDGNNCTSNVHLLNSGSSATADNPIRLVSQPTTQSRNNDMTLVYVTILTLVSFLTVVIVSIILIASNGRSSHRSHNGMVHNTIPPLPEGVKNMLKADNDKVWDEMRQDLQTW